MITVVMPAYHAELTIAESVNSVIEQTYKDWELIVVADDTTSAHAVPKDERITVIVNSPNLGLSKSRNKGIKIARGEWIAFIDADDVWDIRKLEYQLDFMKRKGAWISCTSSTFFNSDYVMHIPLRIDYKKLLKRNVMSCSSVMMERRLALKYPFPSGLITEDYAVWLKILKETGAAYGLDEPLLKYRLSRVSDSSNKFRMALKTYAAYRYAGILPIVAVFLILQYLPGTISKRIKIKKASVSK